MRFRVPWANKLAALGLGDASRGPERWWTRPVQESPFKGCFSTKTAALKAFVEANRALIDEYGGLDYQVSPSEFDAINHKYSLTGKRRVRTIADALWVAMPAGRPFCLDRIDLDALNDTSPARQRDDAAFVLPDEAYADAIAAEEARYYREIEEYGADGSPTMEVAPSSEPLDDDWEPHDDPAARAYVDAADEAREAFVYAARDAEPPPAPKPRRRARRRPAAAQPEPAPAPAPAPIVHRDPKPENVILVRRKAPPAAEVKPARRARKVPRKPQIVRRSKPRKTMSKRIDDSHHPFKRTRKIGNGPKKHPPVLHVKEWECRKGKKKYEQICRYVGPDERRRGTVTTSRMNPKKKKAYNKLYREFAKRNRKDLRKRGARPGYRCRRTRIAKCR